MVVVRVVKPRVKPAHLSYSVHPCLEAVQVVSEPRVELAHLSLQCTPSHAPTGTPNHSAMQVRSTPEGVLPSEVVEGDEVGVEVVRVVSEPRVAGVDPVGGQQVQWVHDVMVDHSLVFL